MGGLCLLALGGKIKLRKKVKFQTKKKSTTGKQQLQVLLIQLRKERASLQLKKPAFKWEGPGRRNYEPYDLAAHKKKYAPELKKMKNPDFQSHATDMAVTNARAYNLSGENITKRRTIGYSSAANEATMLHEMGHIAEANRKGSMNYRQRKRRLNFTKI